MILNKTHFKKITAFILCLAIVTVLFGMCNSNASVISAAEAETVENIGAAVSDTADSYGSYLQKYSSVNSATANIAVDIGTAALGVGTAFKTGNENKNAVAFDADNAAASWIVNVPEDGLYSIEFTYSAIVSKGKAMNIGVKLDNAFPYDEASKITLEQRWKDDISEKKFAEDNSGNDILPDIVQLSDTLTYALKDAEGYYDRPLQFYLKKGDNILTVESSGDAFMLYGIELTVPEKLLSYEEYRAENDKLQNSASNYSEKIQAEFPIYKSDSSIYAAVDKSDPSIEPQTPYSMKRNVIGTSNWGIAGQYLEWEIEIPENGYYEFDFKYKQNTNRGLYNLRSLSIDGEIPFSEAAALRFDYSDTFTGVTLGEEEPYKFYLTKGSHTLRLEVTLGGLTETIMAVEENRARLDALRKKIIMITSVTPDIYRDYDLKAEIPGIVEELEAVSKNLYELADGLEEVTGKEGTNAVTLTESADLLKKFAKNTYLIPEQLSSYTNTISSLSTWVNNLKSQIIELDYFVVSSVDQEVKIKKASFFKKIGYEILMFFNSFVSDYSTINGEGTEGEEVEVWISSGRDQLYILRELIDSSDLDVPVNLKLVRNSITSAIMAGVGPDVILGLAFTEPVNLGMRGALEPLQNYEGFSEVKEEFAASAFTPYELEGNCYAIPETQVFNMMFVRTDILEQLELPVPTTWDEFLNTTRILQQNNMETGLPSDAFATLLYQNGGTYYNEDRSKTAFSEPIALSTFKQWISYYNNYGFSIFKDDYTRFRSGEMPIAIMAYTFCNTLSVAAPEIRNSWKMYTVPGTVGSDGEINNTIVGAAGTACSILSSSDNKEASWKFLKWWAAAETQSAYGIRLESLLGSAGRYATANMEAFEYLAWSADEIAAIKEQWQYVVELPQVPGGYYVTLNLDNAFRACTTRLEEPKETFNYWTQEIDKEIMRKREQYGIN